MADRAQGLCPHGMTSATCLICQTLAPSEARRARPEPARAPSRRRSVGIGPALVVLAVVGIGGLLVVWWIAAFAWALVRLVELVAVATVAGWVGWRLGVRHGRRHPT